MTYVSNADLGGQPQSGAIVPEPGYETFHASWEPQAFALTLAMGATRLWNLDMARSARETLPDYSKLTYYEIWLAGLERMLIERGLVTREELSAGRALAPASPLPRVMRAGDVAAVLAKGAPTHRDIQGTARFSVGNRVRTRSAKVAHHTRLPGYALGKRGRIERVHGAHVFPDTNARGLGEQPQWLYTVVFDAVELWGSDADEHHRISIDAWEAYLEPLYEQPTKGTGGGEPKELGWYRPV